MKTYEGKHLENEIDWTIYSNWFIGMNDLPFTVVIIGASSSILSSTRIPLGVSLLTFSLDSVGFMTVAALRTERVGPDFAISRHLNVSKLMNKVGDQSW